MSYKDPLLFVQGPPPVYVKVNVIQEESTSVFYPSEPIDREPIEAIPGLEVKLQEADPAIVEKVLYLSRPFQRQVYSPLQLVVEGETMQGEIRKVEDGILWLDSENLMTEIEISKIEDIRWRGQSFDKQ